MGWRPAANRFLGPELKGSLVRIAIVHKYYSLSRGGAERYSVLLSRQLAALGHEVAMVGESVSEPLPPGGCFVPVKVDRSSSWARNHSFARNASRAVAHGFDAVLGLCRTPEVDVYRTGRIHAHWMQVRYRNRAHRLLQALNPRHRAILQLERRILTQSSRLRRIVAQCRLDKELLIAHYGVPEAKIEIIYNGVDVDTFRPLPREECVQLRREFRISADEPLLVFSSVTDFKTKGLSSVLAAMRISREQNLRLLVLGRGRRSSRFRRLAAHLGLADRVHFVGYRRDAERFYAAADLCVLPTAYEPFPNVNLEALACGTPVLTTATNGTAEIIAEGGTGYLIPQAEAVGELAERLDHHFQLPSPERRKISQACRETALRMTTAGHTARMVHLFEQVVAERTGRRGRPTLQQPRASLPAA